MRISDWSSDVCSSDLLRLEHAGYTVPTVADGTGSLVYDQVWDVRISPALSVAAQSKYLDYMQTSGSLFLPGAPSGVAARTQSVIEFIAADGGGAVPLPAGRTSTHSVNPPHHGQAYC